MSEEKDYTKEEKVYSKEDVKKLLDASKKKIDEQKNQITDLNNQLENYKSREASIPTEEEIKAFNEQKADVKAREVALNAQEEAFKKIEASLVAASHDLAQKKAGLFKEAEKLAADLREKRIHETEEEIQKMRNSATEYCETLREDAQKVAEKIQSEANDFAEKIRLSAKTEYDRIVNDANGKANGIIDAAKVDTQNLEKQIEELKKVNAELSGKNTELDAQNKALREDKQGLVNELKQQKSEFDNATATYEKTMANFETLRVQLESSGKNVEEFSKKIAEMDTREQKLNAKDDDLNGRNRILAFKEKRNENKSDSLDEREQNIDEEIEKRYSEILADKDHKIERIEKEAASLRNSIHANESIIAKFEDLKAEFDGKNPTEILLDYQRVKQELALALEKVNNTPSYALQKTAADLAEEKEKLVERENAVAEKILQSEALHSQLTQALAEKDSLSQRIDALEKDKKIVEDQLTRLRSTYENPAERDDRIKAINEPLIKEHLDRNKSADLKETEWLKGINDKIEQSGFHFSNRILKAFHTALKTSEMSPLTVLAGVSGTGKSELPRLYSRFGGINFLSMPVEPNWDCQEAMLGYYNSIDNCFEPTDMLRLLAQSQRNIDDQQGLNDVMTMILLDEMNLANVELYFADFLSKLETRRGLKENDRSFPFIGVKIGSKMADFPLRLGRNVLWTGTMNNDETTKTLSDKVLDRGIVINFPRPKTLIRSRKNSVLAEPAPLLLKSNWSSWQNAVDFEDNLINGYKEKIEQINEQLGKAGRALGHRVWQSIENYMSLYPDVIAAESDSSRKYAMNNAFEDQLVQKVMPKLRGLETRGTQKDVLDAIKSIIPETLHEDFKNAVEQNYGQFIWTTSGYLLRDDVEKKDESKSMSETDSTNERQITLEPVIAEAIEKINNGELPRKKIEIKKFLEEKSNYSIEKLKEIMDKTEHKE